jgi:hypothetical protein
MHSRQVLEETTDRKTMARALQSSWGGVLSDTVDLDDLGAENGCTCLLPQLLPKLVEESSYLRDLFLETVKKYGPS